MSTTEVEAGVGEILIGEEELQARIRELGAEISADYAGRELLLVGVLMVSGLWEGIMSWVQAHLVIGFETAI